MDTTTIQPEKLYAYSSLPSPTHTRLLELQPAEEDTAELRCRVHVVHLHDPEIALYEAISYTWGAPAFSHVLWVDGDGQGSQGSRLLITPSLFGALCRFRRRRKPRLVWADAVCINQKDPAEKNTHIQLMTDIYRGASQVLVWLGGGRAGEQMLSRIHSLGRLLLSQSGGLSEQHRRELSESVQNLVLLPWFSRRWIIQEVVMNSNVTIFCGGQKLPFLLLIRDLAILLQQPGLGAPQTSLREAKSLMAMFDLWQSWALGQNQGQSRGLLKLLLHFDHFGCADDKDRVFTLAALAQDVRLETQTEDSRPHSRGKLAEIVVDYAASTREIYTSTAQTIWNSGYPQWILGQAAVRCNALSIAELPSWVPDWRNAVQLQPLWPSARDTPLLGEFIKSPSMWKLANTDACLVRLTLSCVGDWRPSKPERYADRNAGLFNYNGLFNNDSPHLERILEWKSWTRRIYPLSERNAFAPISITWKGEPFPVLDDDDSHGVSAWMMSTFSGLWERVLKSLSEIKNNRLYEESGQGAWILSSDRFAHVITAGGTFLDLLDHEKRQALIEPIDRETPSRYSPPPGKRGDVDLIDSGRFPLVHISDMVRQILLGTAQESPMRDGLLALVAITMRGRCLFTCEVDWKPEDALASDIMGIGSSRVQTGDRIMSFPEEEGPGTSDVRKEEKLMWSSTMVVREATVDWVKIYAALEETRKEHGQRVNEDSPPPIYTFIGDCYLTTTRWLSPSRGLYYKKWKRRTERTISGSGLCDRSSEPFDYEVLFV